MKRFAKQLFCLLLSLTLLVQPMSVFATEQAETTSKISIPKLLIIGNSYSVNVMAYLNKILLEDEEVGEFTLGYLYYPGCSLSMHVKYGQNNEPKYTYYKCETSSTKGMTPNTTLLTALQDEDWDIIYLQEAPLYAAQERRFTPHLDNLIKFVNENKTNPNAKFGWHMTWSYAPGYADKGFEYSKPFVEEFQGDPLIMYNSISNIVQNIVMKKDNFVSMIPAGTAIQNARTSYFGDTMNDEKAYHLSSLGKLIAGYTWYSCLTGKPVEAVTLPGLTFLTSDMDRILVKEAANNAVSNPYSVTPSAYPERLDSHSLNLTGATATVAGQPVTTAVKGLEVTITYNIPNKEMAFDCWNVVRGNVTLADPKSAVTTFIMPDENVTIDASYTNTCPSQSMTDVSVFKWYHEAVDYALTNGIMRGYTAEKFGPDDTLSRAMLVQMLYNKEGTPAVTAKNKFSDVPSDQWYFDAVRWAADKGVVSGYNNGCFDPEGKVTIEQVAVILHNYAGKPAAEGDLSSVGKYDDWAASALQWAMANDVLKNVPFTNATETATRAQTAQMLMNYLNL